MHGSSVEWARGSIAWRDVSARWFDNYIGRIWGIYILADVALLCYISILHWSPNMSTTTIRLPEDLKARVAAAAERAGTTAHGFILEAIAEKTDQAERRADFHDVAEKRHADLVASGKTIAWEKMRSYLEDRIAGKRVARPAAKKLGR